MVKRTDSQVVRNRHYTQYAFFYIYRMVRKAKIITMPTAARHTRAYH